MASHVKEKLESYFENANSTSRRMMVDITDHKKKVNWNYMNENQQADFLWENLISKKAPSQKGLPRPIKNVKDIFTTLNVNPGEKIVIDEDTSNGRPFGCSWRDEHSAPFSWHTKSQLDLRLIDELDGTSEKNEPSNPRRCPNETLSDKNVSMAPARPKKGLKPIETPKRRPPPPPPPPNQAPKPSQPAENTVSKKPLATPNSSSTPKLVLAGGALVMIQENVDMPPEPEIKEPKEKTPTQAAIVPKDELRESVLSVDVELDKNIPKTGFDFLDDW